MPTWKELEAEFREMQETLRFSRLETHWGSSGEYWRLAGSPDSNAKKRFEALAYIAGEKLSETLERSAEGYQEVLSESDSARRWYKGIWKISGNFEYAFPAQELDENGKVVGHIFTGSINRPAEASSVFCLELAAHYPKREPEDSSKSAAISQQPPLRTFWERYGSHIIIGVIVTVLGGLILAFLQS